MLRRIRPAAVLLDILLEVESGWTFLTEMKSHEATRNIPILVLTVVDGRERALALGADDFCLKPIEQGWLLDRLVALATRGPVETILIIDDQESDRRRLQATPLRLRAPPHHRSRQRRGRHPPGARRQSQRHLPRPGHARHDRPAGARAAQGRRRHTGDPRDHQHLGGSSTRRSGGGSVPGPPPSSTSRPSTGQDAFDTIKEALLKAGLSPASTSSEARHG